jgi:hypothetical protein
MLARSISITCSSCWTRRGFDGFIGYEYRPTRCLRRALPRPDGLGWLMPGYFSASHPGNRASLAGRRPLISSHHRAAVRLVDQKPRSNPPAGSSAGPKAMGRAGTRFQLM